MGPGRKETPSSESLSKEFKDVHEFSLWRRGDTQGHGEACIDEGAYFWLGNGCGVCGDPWGWQWKKEHTSLRKPSSWHWHLLGFNYISSTFNSLFYSYLFTFHLIKVLVLTLVERDGKDLDVNIQMHFPTSSCLVIWFRPAFSQGWRGKESLYIYIAVCHLSLLVFSPATLPTNLLNLKAECGCC